MFFLPIVFEQVNIGENEKEKQNNRERKTKRKRRIHLKQYIDLNFFTKFIKERKREERK